MKIDSDQTYSIAVYFFGMIGHLILTLSSSLSTVVGLLSLLTNLEPQSAANTAWDR